MISIPKNLIFVSSCVVQVGNVFKKNTCILYVKNDCLCKSPAESIVCSFYTWSRCNHTKHADTQMATKTDQCYDETLPLTSRLVSDPCRTVCFAACKTDEQCVHSWLLLYHSVDDDCINCLG